MLMLARSKNISLIFLSLANIKLMHKNEIIFLTCVIFIFIFRYTYIFLYVHKRSYHQMIYMSDQSHPLNYILNVLNPAAYYK